MMGQLSSGQERLFYYFNLEEHIPTNHLLRRIDHCLDLSDLRHFLADFYSPNGRPSIDPELMIRMLIVGYCAGTRSERRLCEEAHLNLAYRWFCRLSLEDKVPNHSTFSKNRHGRFRETQSSHLTLQDCSSIVRHAISITAAQPAGKSHSEYVAHTTPPPVPTR